MDSDNHEEMLATDPAKCEPLPDEDDSDLSDADDYFFMPQTEEEFQEQVDSMQNLFSSLQLRVSSRGNDALPMPCLNLD